MAENDYITRGDSDGALRALRDRVVRLEGKIECPPYPGMEEKLNTLIVSSNAVERERLRVQAIQHTQNQEKLDEINSKVGKKTLLVNLAALAVMFAALVVSIFAMFGIGYLSKHSQVEPLEILRGSLPAFAVQSHQNAGRCASEGREAMTRRALFLAVLEFYAVCVVGRLVF